MGCTSRMKVTCISSSLFAAILVFVSFTTFGSYRIPGIHIPQAFRQQELNHGGLTNSSDHNATGFDAKSTNYYQSLSHVLVMLRQSWLQGRRRNREYFDEEYGEVHTKMRSLLDNTGKQRVADLTKLSAEIQRKLWLLQNPQNCADVQLLILDFESLAHGFGSSLHTILLHFLQALYTNRTLVIRSKGWKYDTEGGWEHYMMPLGKCKYDGNMTSISMLSDSGASKARIVKSVRNAYGPYAWKIPRNVYSTLKDIYTQPYAWWIGQFVKYAFRFQPWFEEKLQNKSRLINFTDSTVGLQIRWGDKIGREALKHSVDEYMDFAERWFERRENRKLKRTIYVATEESQAWKDLESNYQEYEFLGGGFVDRSKELEFEKRNNYADRANELEAILTDLHFLSKCQYVVGTYSSNICRLLHELVTINNDEPQDRIQSLDDKMYWLFGLPKYIAIDTHVAENTGNIELAIGDEVIPRRERFKPRIDGYLPGKNLRTNRGVNVPMHKLEIIVTPLDFDL